VTPQLRGPTTIRRRVVVHGHVQAVGFRASCHRRAVDAGVAGWVRNTERGDVEAVFEGPEPAVDALVDWCRTGPPWARVDGIEITDDVPSGDAAFVIR
jgi:acylphosphatase